MPFGTLSWIWTQEEDIHFIANCWLKKKNQFFHREMVASWTTQLTVVALHFTILRCVFELSWPQIIGLELLYSWTMGMTMANT